MKRAKAAMKEFVKHMNGHKRSTDGWEVGLRPVRTRGRRAGLFTPMFYDPEDKQHESLTPALRRLGLKKLDHE